MYPLSINSRYFSTLRASASVAVVPGLHKEPWFRRLGARASTTVTSHTSCLPISQGIMVTPSGRLPSVRYSPRGSSIEGKSRDPNVCFMRELRVAWRARKTVQTVPFNSFTTVARMGGWVEGTGSKIRVSPQVDIPNFLNGIETTQIEIFIT